MDRLHTGKEKSPALNSSPRRTPPLYPIPTGVSPSGRIDTPIKGVIFDVYGTLFISGSGDIVLAEKNFSPADTLGELLKRHQIRISPENIFAALVDWIESAHKAARKRGCAFPEVRIEDGWMEILGIKDAASAREFAIEFENIQNPVYPMPHAEELITHLKGQNRLMGIISNAQFFTRSLFDYFMGADVKQLGFDPKLVFLSYEYGWAKPGGFLFEKALEALRAKGIAPRSVLYVGNDMLNDIFPARRAGFKTALFAGDRRSLRFRRNDGRCRHLKPDLVITDLWQLVAHIG